MDQEQMDKDISELETLISEYDAKIRRLGYSIILDHKNHTYRTIRYVSIENELMKNILMEDRKQANILRNKLLTVLKFDDIKRAKTLTWEEYRKKKISV